MVLLDQLPLRANGKIDRVRLPDPSSHGVAPDDAADGPFEATEDHAALATDGHARSGPGAGADLPRTPSDLLDAVRLAWIDVIGRPDLRTDDNFMDAGGNSLMLVALQQRLLQRTGRLLTVGTLMTHATVEAQARAVAAAPDMTIRADPEDVRGSARADAMPNLDPVAPAAPAPATTSSTAVGAGLAQAATTSWRALRVSAASADGLRHVRHELAALLEEGRFALDDVAHTLDKGRDRFHQRAVVLADSATRAAEALRVGGPLVVAGEVLRQPPVLRLADDAPHRSFVEDVCRGRVPVVRHEGLRLPMGGDVVLDRRGVSWETGIDPIGRDADMELQQAWLLARLWCLGVELPLGALADGRRVRLPAVRRRPAESETIRGATTRTRAQAGHRSNE